MSNQFRKKRVVSIAIAEIEQIDATGKAHRIGSTENTVQFWGINGRNQLLAASSTDIPESPQSFASGAY